jgi:hypothetical protein
VACRGSRTDNQLLGDALIAVPAGEERGDLALAGVSEGGAAALTAPASDGGASDDGRSQPTGAGGAVSRRRGRGRIRRYSRRAAPGTVRGAAPGPSAVACGPELRGQRSPRRRGTGPGPAPTAQSGPPGRGHAAASRYCWVRWAGAAGASGRLPQGGDRRGQQDRQPACPSRTPESSRTPDLPGHPDRSPETLCPPETLCFRKQGRERFRPRATPIRPVSWLSRGSRPGAAGPGRAGPGPGDPADTGLAAGDVGRESISAQDRQGRLVAVHGVKPGRAHGQGAQAKRGPGHAPALVDAAHHLERGLAELLGFRSLPSAAARVGLVPSA